jgi:hypothetical protein
VTSDDGVRLYVDGQNVLGKWIQQGPTKYTVIPQLRARAYPPAEGQGAHHVVLEYFEATGGAVAKFDYEKKTSEPAPPVEPFNAEYFDNSTLTGQPVPTRSDDVLDFDWGDSAPDSVVRIDRFSACWTRTKTHEAGAYRIYVTGDDGIRAG